MLKFSLYSHIHAEAVQRLAAEIRVSLDRALQLHEGGALLRSYDLFWFWVLGAFEVVRTMDKAKGSFSRDVGTRINDYKKRIVVLRAPFAKQEYAGYAQPIASKASIVDFDSARRDAIFEVKGQVFSMRALLDEFDALIAGISASDVLMRREAASKMRGREKPAR